MTGQNDLSVCLSLSFFLSLSLSLFLSLSISLSLFLSLKVFFTLLLCIYGHFCPCYILSHFGLIAMIPKKGKKIIVPLNNPIKSNNPNTGKNGSKPQKICNLFTNTNALPKVIVLHLNYFFFI